MSQRSLFWPLSIVVVSFILVGLLLSNPADTPHAAPLGQNDATQTAYAFGTQTAQAKATVAATETAAYWVHETETAQADDAPTNTPQPTATNKPTDDPTNTPQPTSTSQPTNTPETKTQNSTTPEPAPTPTSKPTDTPQPTVESETPVVEATPTLTPTPDGSLACIYGETEFIEGGGLPPFTMLVLYFDGRPVGGGISDVMGDYRLPLVVVEGFIEHEVEVRIEVRDTHEVVRELSCMVGEPPPKPTRRPP